MEAIAKFDFAATATDELSFRRGQMLKVLAVAEDENWLKGELDGREGLVPSNRIQMKPNPWYYGPITRTEAVNFLNDKPLGSFLVRVSETIPSDLSMTVRLSDSVQHLRILRDPDWKFYLWVVKFNTVNELLEYYRSASVSRTKEVKLKDLAPDYVKALYDFMPQEPGELEFRRGDIVKVTDRSDPNWWKGGLRHLRGQFPANYVVPFTP
ncbi:Protein E(sev)2B [Orchesella cincta]|uniref:Protein E(Sev)2B n=1 Tax=Orchesella cincta TaxID=48709 RepID=A0A1D2N7P8_ORCCI|nr:Protein E(sev)2B [Orchesella cincta]